jgi:ABC-type glycerol-3-phosphate transport system substrate-binding protein
VRIKKISGQGGLLDALNTALQVAPSTSPDVIALDNALLLTAAQSLQPLPVIPAEELSDFFSFTLRSTQTEAGQIALPFAVNTLGLAYSTAAYPTPPRVWADLKPENGTVWLPLNDSTALVTLQQYLARGGALTDADGQAALEADILAKVFSDYQAMQAAGLLPAQSFTANSLDDSWITYRESRASAVIALFNSYLIDRPRVAATGFTFIPTSTGARLTFARQWNYALVATDPSRQAIAIELIRWLTLPENLGAWTLAINTLPPRAEALVAWRSTGLVPTIEQFLTHAQPEPSPAILAVVGPPITAAVQAVLTGQASPESAAAAAANAVR